MASRRLVEQARELMPWSQVRLLHVGKVYMRKEGPVFTAAQIARMPNDF